LPVKNPQTETEWLECIPLPEYIAKIPAGHLISIAGDEIWIDGNGKELSTDAYKKLHSCDPVIVWTAKKRWIAEHGGGVHVG
jgi:hypothetical protein